MRIVIFGLAITSSWGNGHAVTYRSLVRELARRGHDVLFLERDVAWYRENRDLPVLPWGRCGLYDDLGGLARSYGEAVRDAEVVIVGSFVPQGIAIGQWACETAAGLTAFYDIDTPVTVARMERGDCDYLTPGLVRRYGLYLSFTGGPLLRRIARTYGLPMARPLYCSADPELYRPMPGNTRWDLGYMGTYSDDRQIKLNELLIGTARRWPEGRFVVAGPQYPEHIRWGGVERITHLSPREHAAFYSAQRATLNVTRADMVAAGWSPSVRLFEAAACGTPVISDWWEGLAEFLAPGREILIAETAGEVLEYLRLPEAELAAIGAAARERVLAAHTADHRVRQLEAYVTQAARRESRHKVASG